MSDLWKRFTKSSLRSGLLFGTLGVLSWLTGVLFIWPSLGPTAYILAFDRDKNHPFKKVFASHTLGTLAGWLSHHLFAPHVTITTSAQPLEHAVLQITLSAIVALALTTGLMQATGWTHSPACATTLIIALGLVTGLQGTAFILTAVILIYGIHFLTEHLFEKIGWIET